MPKVSFHGEAWRSLDASGRRGPGATGPPDLCERHPTWRCIARRSQGEPLRGAVEGEDPALVRSPSRIRPGYSSSLAKICITPHSGVGTPGKAVPGCFPRAEEGDLTSCEGSTTVDDPSQAPAERSDSPNKLTFAMPIGLDSSVEPDLGARDPSLPTPYRPDSPKSLTFRQPYKRSRPPSGASKPDRRAVSERQQAPTP